MTFSSAAFWILFALFVLAVKWLISACDEAECKDLAPDVNDGTYWSTIEDPEHAMAIMADLTKEGIPYRLHFNEDRHYIAVSYRDRDTLICAGTKWIVNAIDNSMKKAQGCQR